MTQQNAMISNNPLSGGFGRGAFVGNGNGAVGRVPVRSDGGHLAINAQASAMRSSGANVLVNGASNRGGMSNAGAAQGHPAMFGQSASGAAFMTYAQRQQAQAPGAQMTNPLSIGVGGAGGMPTTTGAQGGVQGQQSALVQSMGGGLLQKQPQAGHSGFYNQIAHPQQQEQEHTQMQQRGTGGNPQAQQRGSTMPMNNPTPSMPTSSMARPLNTTMPPQQPQSRPLNTTMPPQQSQSRPASTTIPPQQKPPHPLFGGAPQQPHPFFDRVPQQQAGNQMGTATSAQAQPLSMKATPSKIVQQPAQQSMQTPRPSMAQQTRIAENLLGGQQQMAPAQQQMGNQRLASAASVMNSRPTATNLPTGVEPLNAKFQNWPADLSGVAKRPTASGGPLGQQMGGIQQQPQNYQGERRQMPAPVTQQPQPGMNDLNAEAPTIYFTAAEQAEFSKAANELFRALSAFATVLSGKFPGF